MPTKPVDSEETERMVRTETSDHANEILDLVERWKARVEEIQVQLDLAKLDLHDQAARQLELATNANLAASAKLRDAYHDATKTAEALRDGVEEMLQDVKDAFTAVQAVLERDD